MLERDDIEAGLRLAPPPYTPASTVQCAGKWNSATRCVEGTLTADLIVYSVQVGNQVIARHFMCL